MATPVREPRRRVQAIMLLAASALALLGVPWLRFARPPLRPEVAQARQVVIVAVGDVMLDRGVGDKIGRHGAAHVFANVKDELADGDLRFCNLESPISATGPHKPHACVFRASPEAVAALADASFDIVSIANNHAMDARREGLRNTMTALAHNRIGFAGAAWDEGREPPSAMLRVNGLRLRFLAFTDIGRSDARVSPQDHAEALVHVQTARQRADLLLASVHWGMEYGRRPSEWQRRFAHALLEAGADIVLGHHPHVLQGVEAVDGKLICYSMGNFVFDQRGRERMESAVFRIRHEEGEGFNLRVRPVWIPRATFAPELCDEERGGAILERLRGLCKELGTEMRIQGEVGVVETAIGG
jgi:poly-gamma-glutamate synthesis protein (capsule biosynthesis protein)